MVQPQPTVLTIWVPTSLLVVLDGVVQEPEYSYSTSLSSGQPTITFSAAPDANGRISIVYLGNELLTATPVSSETHIDEFNGDGSTTAFTMTRTPAANSAANYVVFVGNVYQRFGSSYAYTASGDVITFTSAPSRNKQYSSNSIEWGKHTKYCCRRSNLSCQTRF